jgi:hypothetical protein
MADARGGFVSKRSPVIRCNAILVLCFALRRSSPGTCTKFRSEILTSICGPCGSCPLSPSAHLASSLLGSALDAACSTGSGVFCCVYSGQVEQLVERGQTRAIGGRSLLPSLRLHLRPRKAPGPAESSAHTHTCTRACVRACMRPSLSERACAYACSGVISRQAFRMKDDKWRVCTDRARLQMHWSWRRTR